VLEGLLELFDGLEVEGLVADGEEVESDDGMVSLGVVVDDGLSYDELDPDAQPASAPAHRAAAVHLLMFIISSFSLSNSVCPTQFVQLSLSNPVYPNQCAQLPARQIGQ